MSKLYTINQTEKALFQTLLEAEKRRVDSVNPPEYHKQAVKEYRHKVVRVLNRLDLKYKHY